MMIRFLAAAFLVLLAAPALGADLPTLPDPAITPGSLNPAITQRNITSTICKSGWTATVRPSASFTNNLKRRQLAQYRYPSGTRMNEVEEDHRVPLELGGNPTDPSNLWPEPWEGSHGAHAKDRLENAVKRDVCARRLTLAEGQSIFLGDWWPAYEARFGALAQRPRTSRRSPPS